MSDNITLDPGSGGSVVATDDDGTAHHQYVKLEAGADGTQTKILAGGGVEAGALRVTVASDSTGVLSVDDNGSTISVDDGGGALTVDGTVAVSGTVAVTDNSGSLTVDNADITATAAAAGATTDAEATSDGSIVAILKRLRTLLSGGLPAALGANGGLKIEGVASGTAVPVSGTVTVTDGSGSLTVDGTVAAAQSGTWTEANSAAALTSLQLIDDAVYTDGSGSPSKAIAVAGTDGTNPQILSTNASGHLNIADGGNTITVDGTVAVTGVATAANQSTLIGHVDGVEALLTTIDADTSNLSVVGGGTEAAAIRVTVANNSTGVLSVDDNGASLTVDGSVTADTELTTADLDTGAGTDTRAVVGIAGTASGGAQLIPGSSTDGLLVNLGANNDVTVSGVATAANQSTLIGHVDGVEALLTTIDADTGGILADTAAIETATEACQAALETAGGLVVNLGANNDVTVTGTVDLGAVDNAVLDAIAADGDAVQALLTTIDADTGGILTSVQTLDNAISGSEMQVDVVAALPAGTNNIGDVDVASIAAGTNAIGNVGIVPRTSGGLTIFRSVDLDESEEEVKATAGQLFGWYIFNAAATTRYVKLYNATAANTTVGSTTPILTLPVPAGGAANVFTEMGIPFSTALSAAATTGVADADTGAPSANDVVINLFYA